MAKNVPCLSIYSPAQNEMSAFYQMSNIFRSDLNRPIPVALLSKAYVCGHLIAGIAESNPTEGMDVRLLT